MNKVLHVQHEAKGIEFSGFFLSALAPNVGDRVLVKRYFLTAICFPIKDFEPLD